MVKGVLKFNISSLRAGFETYTTFVALLPEKNVNDNAIRFSSFL